MVRADVNFLKIWNSDQVGLFTSELLTIEYQKQPIFDHCPQNILFSFNQIFMKLADNQDRQKLSGVEFPPDRTVQFGVNFSWMPENAPIAIIKQILEEFKFLQNERIQFGVTCQWVTKNPYLTLFWT